MSKQELIEKLWREKSWNENQQKYINSLRGISEAYQKEWEEALAENFILKERIKDLEQEIVTLREQVKASE